jgi:hypothetical protein
MSFVTEQIIKSNKKAIEDLNKEILVQAQFKDFIKDKSACFNCEHNIRLYIDKGECSINQTIYPRTHTCSKFKKRK